ncbi:hypothetical protein [Nonomuraea polychroma]|nr:hypothetical protein [Nonomuraea polychroma]
MGKAIMGCAAVSADGYIAYDDGQVGSLFDWMSAGKVEWKLSESDEDAMQSTQASKDFMQSVYTDIGAVIMGRNLFDQTNGWNGVPAAGDHVFVVTHEAPTDWEYADWTVNSENGPTMPDNTEQQRKVTADAAVPIELALLEHRSFEQGVTMHLYAIQDAKEASSC